MAAMVTSVANRRGVSNRLPRARLIRTPSPDSPPAHSPMMAPITASVAPTRMPAKIEGSAPGISSRVSTWSGDARNTRPTSSSWMSTDLTPTMVATAIGKKTMSAQMMTLDRSPVPNQSAIKGASARIGVACAATR